MASIKLNDGKIQILKIDPKYRNTKFYLTVNSEPSSNDIILAGATGVGLFTYKSRNLQFEDEILGYGFELENNILEVNVRPTKFPSNRGELEVSNVPVKCKLAIEAGDDLIERFILTDQQNLSINPVFEFKIGFSF